MTIFALSSGAGRAGVAVIRISGPASLSALEQLTGSGVFRERQARLCTLIDPRTGIHLDQALVLYFRGPRSFTGEDVAELHVHGGRAVINAVLDALESITNLRPAEPGEFTRRAFLNGKLDLTAIEGLADLVAAETEAQRRQAARVAEGGLRHLYEQWRSAIVRTQALMETAIDFSEDDVPDDLETRVDGAIDELVQAITSHLSGADRGERLRDGFHVVILGRPNVGKSSLLNWLARRDAAIVSDQAGTTRDVVEVHLDLDGYPVIVADTAGLRRSADRVEREGVDRARRRAADADLKIVVLDSTDQSGEAELWEHLDPATIAVVNKIDQVQPAPSHMRIAETVLPVSVRTGAGMDALMDALTSRVRTALDQGAELVPIRMRHRSKLHECLDHLHRAKSAPTAETRAEDLRLAARALGAIVGTVDVEDILDVIFADFCIGK